MRTRWNQIIFYKFSSEHLFIFTAQVEFLGISFLYNVVDRSLMPSPTNVQAHSNNFFKNGNVIWMNAVGAWSEPSSSLIITCFASWYSSTKKSYKKNCLCNRPKSCPLSFSLFSSALLTRPVSPYKTTVSEE